MTPHHTGSLIEGGFKFTYTVSTDYERAVIVKCTMLTTNGEFITDSSGCATVHPDDKFQYHIGYSLALARAMNGCAEDLEESVFRIRKHTKRAIKAAYDAAR